MSVYFVAQWSVADPDADTCRVALGGLAAHIREAHPGILSVRTYRQAWGPLPRRGFSWIEEFASLTAMESEPDTPACREAWAPIHALALPATYTGSVWTDPDREVWFES